MLNLNGLLAGPNGCGKSTLLRLIMGQEKPISGWVQLGPHNIVPAYFAQNQADALDLKQNVLQTMVKAAPDAQLNDVKALLGRMMFSGKAMEKKVRFHLGVLVLGCGLGCLVGVRSGGLAWGSWGLPVGFRMGFWVLVWGFSGLGVLRSGGLALS